jgi:hypothetical protein
MNHFDELALASTLGLTLGPGVFSDNGQKTTFLPRHEIKEIAGDYEHGNVTATRSQLNTAS